MDPKTLEGGEGSHDGSTVKDGVFPLWRGVDLDLHGGWGEGRDLFLHAIGDTREQGRSCNAIRGSKICRSSLQYKKEREIDQE